MAMAMGHVLNFLRTGSGIAQNMEGLTGPLFQQVEQASLAVRRKLWKPRWFAHVQVHSHMACAPNQDVPGGPKLLGRSRAHNVL